MTLLAEYALTPDVFDETCYASAELCGVHLQGLKEVLLQEALVRDLRDGEWSRSFRVPNRAWHMRGKELLKKLVSQGRLRTSSSARAVAPTSDAEWCDEAVASHVARALTGVIVSNSLSHAHGASSVVAAIGRLAGAAWWNGRSSSLRLGRTLADYQAALDLAVRHANSLMLIDPYFDPGRGCRDIVAVLGPAGQRTLRPLIEIHRVAWLKGDDKRPQVPAVEALMRAGLQPAATSTGLSFEVFLWDDFHDRYLISDLVGISVPHGFATTAAPGAITTWTRLGRADRDDVQREFDRSSLRHALRHQFSVR